MVLDAFLELLEATKVGYDLTECAHLNLVADVLVAKRLQYVRELLVGLDRLSGGGVGLGEEEQTLLNIVVEDSFVEELQLDLQAKLARLDALVVVIQYKEIVSELLITFD